MATNQTHDTEPTLAISAHDETTDPRANESNKRASRRRRVRLNYPASLVQLAVNLQQRLGVRRTAGILGLQLSTLYRWVGHHNAAYRHAHARPCPPDLAARYGESGFPVDNAIRTDELLPFPTLRETAVLNPGPDRTRDKIMAAKALLDQRFVEPWTCGRLARCCGLSRLHFIRVFARYVGVPPYQYLTRVRVERARELSMEPNRPLRAIAREVGFGSTSSLHRAFHRYLGASPGELFNCAGNF
jgi:AraC-like DNA-binding protein